MPLNVPSNFKADLVLDRQSVEAVKAQLSQVFAREATEAVGRLSDAATRLLHDLDKAAGHDFLAKQWARTGVRVSADRVEQEVYSLLEEEETLYAVSSATGLATGKKGQVWPFAGRDLITWLEYGTGAHTIKAAHAGTLAFEPGTNHTAFVNDPGGSLDDFLEPEKDDLSFRREVLHPGFRGNAFIRQTQEIIEQRLAEEANYTASRVSVSLR